VPFRPRYTGLIDEYRDRLPVHDDTRVIGLGEGNTPLIRLNNVPGLIGKGMDIYVKYEGLNPTGSFKDRGMTMAVTKAVEAGSRAVICASTGNTSASAAAYAARAGITAHWIGYCEYSPASGGHVTAACSFYKGHCRFAGGAIVGNRPRMVGYQAAASATSVAGALRDIQRGKITEGASVVGTLTGHGLKDPDTAIKQSTSPMVTVDAELDAVKRAILDHMA
jgi:threonine synthase